MTEICGENRPFERTFAKRRVQDGNRCLGHLSIDTSADFPVDLACVSGIIVPSVGKGSNRTCQPSLLS